VNLAVMDRRRTALMFAATGIETSLEHIEENDPESALSILNWAISIMKKECLSVEDLADYTNIEFMMDPDHEGKEQMKRVSHDLHMWALDEKRIGAV